MFTNWLLSVCIKTIDFYFIIYKLLLHYILFYCLSYFTISYLEFSKYTFIPSENIKFNFFTLSHVLIDLLIVFTNTITQCWIVDKKVDIFFLFLILVETFPNGQRNPITLYLFFSHRNYPYQNSPFKSIYYFVFF